jgi:hypothetical protein
VRSPQGWPVVVQAGASEAGKELAARAAEVIFVTHQTLEEAQAFYRDVKGRLAKYGRQPEHLKIMPGIFPVIGRTQEEAHEKFDALQALIHPTVGLSLLSNMSGGVDLSQYPVDGPLPKLPETNGGKSRQRLLFVLAGRENLTICDLYLRIAGARGHQQVVGTPQSIADQLHSNGSRRKAPRASTSCRRGCRAGSLNLPGSSCPNCSGGARSEPNTKGARCVTIWVCRGRRTVICSKLRSSLSQWLERASATSLTRPTRPATSASTSTRNVRSRLAEAA